MKRILTVILLFLYVISITGCSAARVEKEPITIENGSSDSTGSVTPSSDPATPDVITVTPSVDNAAAASGSDQTDESTVSPSVSPVLLTSDYTDIPGTSSELNGTISDEAYPSVIELEGTEETVNYKTYHSNLGYQMAFDIDRFSIVSTLFEDGISWKDSLVVENPNPDIYPYSYITILRGDYFPSVLPPGKNITDFPKHEDTDNIHYIHVKDDKGVFLSGIGLKESDELIEQDTVQLGDNKAYHYVVKSGDSWNSMILDTFIVVANDYVYLISAHYFLEASEGYGARMRAMINTITFD